MMPASELTDGAWRARWGHYSVYLVKRADRLWRWAVRVDGSEPHVGRFAMREATRAGHRAGHVLEKLGCHALVDGQRQELAKFLAFEPVDAAEVAFIP